MSKLLYDKNPKNRKNIEKEKAMQKYGALNSMRKTGVTVEPDEEFTRDATGIGSIEYFSPGLIQNGFDITYNNGHKSKHPLPGTHGIKYDPETNDTQDIAMDMLHGLSYDDENYRSKRGEFKEALLQHRGEDIDYYWKQQVEREGEGDGKEAFINNFVDGEIRNGLFEGDDKKFRDHKYSRKAQEELKNDPKLSKIWHNLEGYIRTRGGRAAPGFKSGGILYEKRYEMFQNKGKIPEEAPLSEMYRIYSNAKGLGKHSKKEKRESGWLYEDKEHNITSLLRGNKDIVPEDKRGISPVWVNDHVTQKEVPADNEHFNWKVGPKGFVYSDVKNTYPDLEYSGDKHWNIAKFAYTPFFQADKIANHSYNKVDSDGNRYEVLPTERLTMSPEEKIALAKKDYTQYFLNRGYTKEMAAVEADNFYTKNVEPMVNSAYSRFSDRGISLGRVDEDYGKDENWFKILNDYNAKNPDNTISSEEIYNGLINYNTVFRKLGVDASTEKASEARDKYMNGINMKRSGGILYRSRYEMFQNSKKIPEQGNYWDFAKSYIKDAFKVDRPVVPMQTNDMVKTDNTRTSLINNKLDLETPQEKTERERVEYLQDQQANPATISQGEELSDTEKYYKYNVKPKLTTLRNSTVGMAAEGTLALANPQLYGGILSAGMVPDMVETAGTIDKQVASKDYKGAYNSTNSLALQGIVARTMLGPLQSGAAKGFIQGAKQGYSRSKYANSRSYYPSGKPTKQLAAGEVPTQSVSSNNIQNASNGFTRQEMKVGAKEELDDIYKQMTSNEGLQRLKNMNIEGKDAIDFINNVRVVEGTMKGVNYSKGLNTIQLGGDFIGNSKRDILNPRSVLRHEFTHLLQAAYDPDNYLHTSNAYDKLLGRVPLRKDLKAYADQDHDRKGIVEASKKMHPEILDFIAGHSAAPISQRTQMVDQVDKLLGYHKKILESTTTDEASYGVSNRSMDKVRGFIDSKKTEFLNEYGQVGYDAAMRGTQSYIPPTEDISGKFTNPYSAYNYWLKERNGVERTPMLSEVRSKLLQDKTINNAFDQITPETLKASYDNYFKNTPQGSRNQRVFNIIENDPQSFKILSSVLNKVFGSFTGAAVGTSMYNKEKKNGTN